LKRPPQALLVSLLMLMLARAGWIALLRTSGRGYYSLSYQGRANRRENESNIRESRSPPQGRRLPVTQPVPGGGPAGGGHYCRIAVYSDRGGQVGSGQLQLAGPGHDLPDGPLDHPAERIPPVPDPESAGQLQSPGGGGPQLRLYSADHRLPQPCRPAVDGPPGAQPPRPATQLLAPRGPRRARPHSAG